MKYYDTCSKSVFTFLFDDDNEWVGGGGKLCVNSSLTPGIRVLLTMLLNVQFFWHVTPCC